MRPTVADGVAWSVRRLVCLSLGLSWAPQKNCRTDRDAIWVVDSDVPKEALLHGGAHWRNLANTIEPSVCGGEAVFLSNYFDHLLPV